MTDNYRASILMVLTMAGFSLEDSFIKLASERVPVGQILAILGIGGTLVMFIAARATRATLLNPLMLSLPALIRNGCEMVSMMLGMSALALLPLSTVSAIIQAAPLVTTMGAAVFLREAVGWRRWSAVAVGLAGVLLILRPGSTGFQPAMLLSAASVLLIAARDLATRSAPQGLTVVQLNFWGYAMTTPVGLVLLAAWGEPPVWPGGFDWALIGGCLILGVTFYYTLTWALRMGESSVVVPFRYSRMVFALILGALIFAERPDRAMLAGTALVVASGLYTLMREARLRRKLRLRPFPSPVRPL